MLVGYMFVGYMFCRILFAYLPICLIVRSPILFTIFKTHDMVVRRFPLFLFFITNRPPPPFPSSPLYVSTQASDCPHLSNERIRCENLVKAKSVLIDLFEALASMPSSV
jgi:hypothetical protein